MHGQVNNNKKPFIYSSWGVRHALKHTHHHLGQVVLLEVLVAAPPFPVVSLEL